MARILCAGVSAYKGMETEAKPGEWVSSWRWRPGPAGHRICQGDGLARRSCGRDEKKLELARASGAEVTVNALLSDAPAQVVRRTGGGTHGARVTSPSIPGFHQAIHMVRRKGTVALVGLPPGNCNPPFRGCSRPHHDTRIDCGRPPGPRGSDRVRRRREGSFPLPRDEARRHQPGVQRHESRETRWPDGHDVFLKVDDTAAASPQRRGRQGGTKINVKSARVVMNVLVFNAGSSSLKFGLFQCAMPRPIVVGAARH